MISCETINEKHWLYLLVASLTVYRSATTSRTIPTVKSNRIFIPNEVTNHFSATPFNFWKCLDLHISFYLLKKYSSWSREIFLKTHGFFTGFLINSYWPFLLYITFFTFHLKWTALVLLLLFLKKTSHQVK